MVAHGEINALGAGALGRVYLIHNAVKYEYLALKVLNRVCCLRTACIVRVS